MDKFTVANAGSVVRVLAIFIFLSLTCFMVLSNNGTLPYETVELSETHYPRSPSGYDNTYLIDISSLKLSRHANSPHDSYRSKLILRRDGTLLTPHGQHAAIAGNQDSFSHWGNHLYVSPPSGAIGAHSYTCSYPRWLRYHTYMVAVIVLCLAYLLVDLIRHRAAYKMFFEKTFKLYGIVIRGLTYLFVGLGCLYLLSVVWAMVAKVALPPAFIFSLFPPAQKLAEYEFMVPYLLLAIAVTGALLGCLTRLYPRETNRNYRRLEFSLLKILRWYAIPVAVALYLFTLGTTWHGITNPSDTTGASLHNLVPFSDAATYFKDTTNFLKNRNYNHYGLRRPAAAAVRSSIMFSAGGTYRGYAMLQVVLVALSVTFAASALARYKGLWAGLAFFAFTTIFARTYIGTLMTEPLGLMLGCLGVGFFMLSLQRRNLALHTLGIAAVSLALSIRMGAMFLIPALLVWTLYRFRHSWKSRSIAIMAALLALSLSLGMTPLITALYGSSSGATGSNFAWTLCGLSIGTTWDGPQQAYKQELQQCTTEKMQAAFLYRQALENIKRQPQVFIKRLWDGEKLFLLNVHKFVFEGYNFGRKPVPTWFIAFVVAGILACICSRYKTALSDLRSDTPVFWLIMAGAILLSVPFVMYDDGWRVLTATHPLVFALFASLLAPTRTGTIAHMAVWKVRTDYGLAAILLALIIVSMPVVPAIAHYFEPLKQNKITPLVAASKAKGEEIIKGSPVLTGFAVFEDGEPLPLHIPAVSLTAFVQQVKATGIEQYQPLVTPQPPPTPFGVALVANYNGNSSYVIIPIQMLGRHDVALWKIRTVPWRYAPNPPFSEYWREIVHYEPVMWRELSGNEQTQ